MAPAKVPKKGVPMRFAVLVFPGTWSDCDFHYVISDILHQPVEYVWHRDRDLSRFDCVILPGGFSYGDYLRAGAVAGRSPVVESLHEFIASGKYSIEEIVAKVGKTEINMLRKWPVRKPRPFKEKLDVDIPLVTGMRILDSMFPVAKGGTACIPSPFGSGCWT